MVAVIGATGLIGVQVCAQLSARGVSWCAVVRPGTDQARVPALTALAPNSEVVSSLEALPEAVDVIVLCASAMYSSADFDDAEHRLPLEAIDLAKARGVSRFVLLSVSDQVREANVFLESRRKVERQLKRSALPYTILRPGAISERWFSASNGFSLEQRRATIFGDGRTPIGFMAAADVAQAIVSSILHESAEDATLELAGPTALTQFEALECFAQHGVKLEPSVQSLEVLREELLSQADPRLHSQLALRLSYAQGVNAPMAAITQALGLVPTTFSRWVQSRLGA
jgi:uncharacterized protein YbjT (DUF2867 family)